MPTDIINTIKVLKDIATLSNTFNVELNTLCGGSLNWTIDNVITSYTSLFDRFCPIKIGDRVKLIRDIDISDAPGWECSKHFLVAESTGTIHTRTYKNDKFTYGIMFDNESWLKDGIPQYMDFDHRCHIFTLTEDHITKS